PVADRRFQARQVKETVAGDVREPAHVDLGGEQLEDRAYVDHRRLEQLVRNGPAAELWRSLAQVGKHAAGKRQPVRVDAAGRDADDRVAGLDAGAGDHAVELDEPDARRAEVEAVGRRVALDQLGQLRELAAGNLDPG